MADGGNRNYIRKGCVMELFEMLPVDFEHMDERGKLVQLVHQGYEQINVIKTVAGVRRGEHYHKSVKEAFYIVSGSVEVELKSTQNEVSCKKKFWEGEFFLIPPLVAHNFFFPEDCIMLAMYDRHIVDNQGNKDIYCSEG